jgi:hypothetical protein
VVSKDAVEIGQLRSFGEVGSSRALIDASVYGEDWTDFVLGLQDGSEVAAVIAYDPVSAGHLDLIDSYNNEADTPITLNVTHDDSGFDVYVTCLITTLTRGGALDGLLQMSLTLKIVNPGVVDAS